MLVPNTLHSGGWLAATFSSGRSVHASANSAEWHCSTCREAGPSGMRAMQLEQDVDPTSGYFGCMLVTCIGACVTTLDTCMFCSVLPLPWSFGNRAISQIANSHSW